MAAVLVAGLAETGCGLSANVPTWSPEGPDAGIPAALIEGTLLFEDGCFWVSADGSSAKRVPLLWPPGYSGSAAPPVIRDGQGNVVVEAGSRVAITGGFVDMTANPCATRGVWMVGEVTPG